MLYLPHCYSYNIVIVRWLKVTSQLSTSVVQIIVIEAVDTCIHVHIPSPRLTFILKMHYSEEVCAEERRIAEEERRVEAQRDLEEELWLKRERQAQEEFRRKREVEEKIVREREEREVRVRTLVQ